MTFEQFFACCRRLRMFLKFGGPNIDKPEEVEAWFEVLAEIPFEEFKQACVIARDTGKEFPTIAEFFRLCGRERFTSDQEANRVAEAILEAAGHPGSQGRQSLGELAFEVSQSIGGFWDLSQLSLHDASVYNTQKRRLASIALKKMRAKELETAPTDNLQLTNALKIESGHKINETEGTKQQSSGKTPVSPSLSSLISGLKERISP